MLASQENTTKRTLGGINRDDYQQILKRIGSNIKRYRKANKLLQTQLAAKLQISPSTVTNIERGTVSVPLKTLYKLSQEFNIHIVQLLMDDDTLCLSKRQILNRFICEKGE